MGTWKPVESIFGEREMWRPDAPGDWPTYSAGQPMREGIIPPPCPVCTGDIIRRLVNDGVGVVARYEREKHVWDRLGRMGKERGTEPVMGEITEHFEYDLVHIRRRHMDAKAGTTADDAPDLTPLRRV